MLDWLKDLDRLLRGDATRPELLRHGTVDIPLGGIAILGILLGIAYGLCMGVFSLTGAGSRDALQILATAVKVPALFFLTLLVTFPSLYVFNALVGSRLGLISVLRLLVAAIGIMITVLASLGPIVAFFALTTTSYAFMKLLNVAVFTVAGILGGGFLLRTLQRLTQMLQALEDESAQPPPPASPHKITVTGEVVADIPTPRDPEITGPLPPVQQMPPLIPGPQPLARRPEGANVRAIFRIWVIVFGLVGAQMAWILRPFIGNPQQPFEWFRPVESNFFEAVANTLRNLFS
jgi:hypothetical protein